MGDAAATLYVYGSVANGTARPGASDVDLLSVNYPHSAELSANLTRRFPMACRYVEVAAMTSADLQGDTDEAHGIRVFLRHYCVHLTGTDVSAGLPVFRADARAARGFNGDLGRHWRTWQEQLVTAGTDIGVLGRRVARKTLLAVAGMVSVHDKTWTTDRLHAADRWSEIEPALGAHLAQLWSWADGAQLPALGTLASMVADGGPVATVVQQFDAVAGLWTSSHR
ncbi:nucleotidyltransferase domain-containing protein [Promicromonospora sp. NPDC023805]|uniref:nucleotidyltransferase domain-containing protein n=1 Tax=Promicromonospora sp. NPDC023805 TaxID=3154696 RepID=UPI0033D0FA30